MRAPTKWILAAVGLLMVSHSVFARAPEPRSLTLLVVPERYNVIQLAFDIIAKRPAVLVSYRGDAATLNPVLHAWTGERWRPVTMEEYKGGHFLIQQPMRIILVGDDRLLPLSLVKASDWGPLVMSVNTVEQDDLLNTLGRVLEFSRSEWRWFARRYNMTMEDVSPRRDSRSWYDQMTASRQQPQRRHVDDVAPAPVMPSPRPAVMEQPTPQPIRPVPEIEAVPEKPAPEAKLERASRPERPAVAPAPRPAPAPAEAPVPVVEAVEWEKAPDAATRDERIK